MLRGKMAIVVRLVDWVVTCMPIPCRHFNWAMVPCLVSFSRSLLSDVGYKLSVFNLWQPKVVVVVGGGGVRLSISSLPAVSRNTPTLASVDPLYSIGWLTLGNWRWASLGTSFRAREMAIHSFAQCEG